MNKQPLLGLNAITYKSWVGPIISVYFSNGQLGYVLNFPTHDPHMQAHVQV